MLPLGDCSIHVRNSELTEKKPHSVERVSAKSRELRGFWHKRIVIRRGAVDVENWNIQQSEVHRQLPTVMVQVIHE